MKSCTICHGTDGVHRGLCRTCRTRMRGESVGAVPRHDEHANPTHSAPRPQGHDQPWIARSSFTGRTRRSPRS